MSLNLDRIEKTYFELALWVIAILNFVCAFPCLIFAVKYNDKRFVLFSMIFVGLSLILLGIEFLIENVRRKKLGVPAKQADRFGYSTTFNYRAASQTHLTVILFAIGFIAFFSFLLLR